MEVPTTDGATDSAVASSKADWQAIFPLEIRAATASETPGTIVMSGGCFVLKFPLCRLAMAPSPICFAVVMMVDARLTQGRRGRNQTEPQNIEAECRMSKEGIGALCQSCFINGRIPYFDILRFDIRYSSLLIGQPVRNMI